MNKKAIICILAGLLLIPGSSMVRAELSVTDRNAFVSPGKDSGYFCAKIENTGTTQAAIGDGKLVLFSPDDDILTTSDYIDAYPNRLILNPGEYTYVNEFLWNSALKNQEIGDIKFSVSEAENGREVQPVSCESSYHISGSNNYDNYIYITVTNDSQEIQYGYFLIVALYDQEDRLVYVDKNRYEQFGLHPGSTSTIGMYIDTDTVNYFEATGIEISKVDALVYYLNE